MKDWKANFSDVILGRGLEYCESNAVRTYTCSGSHISAQVAGSKMYNVSIYFENMEISSMHCDCPYEGNCKHIAATLYYLDNHQDLMNHEDYSDLISSLTYDELVEFLYEELPKNPDLANKLKLLKNHEADSRWFHDKLENCFNSPVRVIDFMNEDLQNLKNAKQINLLFSLLKRIVDYLAELNYYGQYDAYDDVLDTVESVINNLLDLGYEKQTCDFLEEFILNSEDECVLDIFTDTYSRYRSVEELFDANFKRIN